MNSKLYWKQRMPLLGLHMACMIALALIGSFFLRYGYKVYAYISSAGFRFGVLIPGVLIILILMCCYGVAIHTIKRGI